MEVDFKEIIALIKVFSEPFKILTKKASQGLDKFYDTGLTAYLNKSFAENISTKTFIHGDSVPLYEVFYPLTLSNSAKTSDYVANAEDLFKIGERISIIGNAGCGKSLLSKHLFLQIVSDKLGIPLLINLRDLNNYNESFEKFIYAKIFNFRLYKEKRTSSWLNNKSEFQSKKQENLFEKALGTGDFIFILDGFDEIHSKKIALITNQLSNFIQKSRLNKFVITSRPGTNIESLAGFKNLYVKDLSDNEIPEFIKTQLPKNEALVNEMVEVIDSHNNRDYRFLLKNPLLLAMFIMTYSLHPELPRSKSEFYWNVFDTLYTKHDSKKEPGFKHEKIAFLQKRDYLDFLNWFSFYSYFEGQYSFKESYIEDLAPMINKELNFNIKLEDLIWDLEVGVGIFIRDGLEYVFPHRSLQEYFCAQFISKRDTNTKTVIYEEEFEDLAKSANEITNFWTLCLELDKEFFLRYFVIPIITDFLKEVKKISLLEQTKAILTRLSISHSIRQYMGPKHFVWDPVSFENTVETKLLSLLFPAWIHYFDINNFENEYGALSMSRNYFEEFGSTDKWAETTSHTIDYSKHFDKQLYIILKSVNLPHQLKTFIYKLQEIIDNYQKQLDNHQHSELSLLSKRRKNRNSL